MTTTGRATAMFLTLALLPVLAGCFEHTTTVGAGAPHAPAVYDHWEHFWLGGLIGHTRVDVARTCPSGDATIESEQTFLNGLVSALTGGIYTPVSLRIRCADGRRTDLGLTSEEVERIVRDERFLDWVAAELPERAEEVARAQLQQ